MYSTKPNHLYIQLSADINNSSGNDNNFRFTLCQTTLHKRWLTKVNVIYVDISDSFISNIENNRKSQTCSRLYCFNTNRISWFVFFAISYTKFMLYGLKNKFLCFLELLPFYIEIRRCDMSANETNLHPCDNL